MPPSLPPTEALRREARLPSSSDNMSSVQGPFPLAVPVFMLPAVFSIPPFNANTASDPCGYIPSSSPDNPKGWHHTYRRPSALKRLICTYY